MVLKTTKRARGTAWRSGAALGLVSALFAAPAYAEAPRNKVSGDADRKQVSITVYNQGFGLVREVRDLKDLGTGRVALEFRDVASTVQPETVAVKSAGGTLRVLEQNYRFDLLTPETLLEKYVGRSVRAYRYHEATGKEDVVDAQVLSVAGGPVLQIGREITFGYPGRLAFPEVPPDKPTMRQIAATTGGRFYEAESAGDLKDAYDNMGSLVSQVKRKEEVTFAFLGGGLVLLLAAAGIAVLTFPRLP